MADDVDDFIDVEISDQQAFEDVQSVHHLIQAEVEPAGDRVHAKSKPFAKQIAQVQDPGLAVAADDVEVDAVVPLQVCRREQVIHQLLEIHPIGARHDHQPGRILVVRLVTQILHHG
jgi:hypothetical protein